MTDTETIVLFGPGGASAPSGLVHSLPFSKDMAVVSVDVAFQTPQPEKKDHLGLSERDGFKLRYSREKPIPEEKHVEHNGQRYVTAADLTGGAGGRLHEWKLVSNVASARARNWPYVKPAEFKDGHIAICGSGPSLGRTDQLKELRVLQKKGVKVHAVNRCHDFLCTKGIVPWSASLLDPIPHVARYIKPRKGVRYEIGSQCDPSVFDVFQKPGLDYYVWHARLTPNLDKIVFTPEELNYAVPSRTSTNGLRSIMLKYMEGFRHFHLFGFDSSYETYRDENGALAIKLGADGKGKLHAHPKPETLHDIRFTKVVEKHGDKVVYEADYVTNSPMLAQAEEFKTLISDIAHGIRDGFMDQIYLYVHGDGLIPDIACSHNYRLHFDRKRNRSNE